MQWILIFLIQLAMEKDMTLLKPYTKARQLVKPKSAYNSHNKIAMVYIKNYCYRYFAYKKSS